MRTFFSDTTKIDVIAQISGDDLEVDRLVLRRFEGFLLNFRQPTISGLLQRSDLARRDQTPSAPIVST